METTTPVLGEKEDAHAAIVVLVCVCVCWQILTNAVNSHISVASTAHVVTPWVHIDAAVTSAFTSVRRAPASVCLSIISTLQCRLLDTPTASLYSCTVGLSPVHSWNPRIEILIKLNVVVRSSHCCFEVNRLPNNVVRSRKVQSPSWCSKAVCHTLWSSNCGW